MGERTSGKKWLSPENRIGLVTQKVTAEPEQRIASDINTFVTTAEPLTVGLASNAASFTAFSIVLFNISPTLFAGTFALGAAGTWMTRRAGKELISLNDAEAKTQNAYRNGIVDANSNAQNIALWGAGRSRNKPA